jgi:hypothetical protein
VTARLLAVSSLVVLAAGLAVGQSACGDGSSSSKGSADDRAAVRAAVRSIDLAVTRVEGRAALSSGEAGLRALEVRRLLDKWHNTHTAVFAVDPRAARGRVQSVLDWLAELSPTLVTMNRSGRPTAIDDAGVARALTPDTGTRALASQEQQTIDRKLGVLKDRLSGRPATMVIVGDRDVPGASADDVLLRLQSRLQMLYPDDAQRVMQLRIGLPR